MTGLTVILALVNTFAAIAPHGTCGWHSADLDRRSSARSFTAGDACAGLAGGTAISMTFLAKSFGSEAAPAATTWSMFFGLAEANTSAGRPAVICVARAELAPKLNVTFTPGWAASNCWPSLVNVSFSDAAAKTVIAPVSEDEVGGRR